MIALMASKGGVGKSTLAVNLAGALSRRGPTVLSDEDEEIRTAQDWMGGSEIPVQLLVPGEQPDPATTAYWVLDTEGRPKREHVVEMSRVALVLIPTGPNGNEINPMYRMWTGLQEAGASMENVRVVVTKAPPVGSVGQGVRDELRTLGVNVCETVVRHYTAHQRASEAHQLVREMPAGQNAWFDIMDLALEIC